MVIPIVTVSFMSETRFWRHPGQKVKDYDLNNLSSIMKNSIR